MNEGRAHISGAHVCMNGGRASVSKTAVFETPTTCSRHFETPWKHRKTRTLYVSREKHVVRESLSVDLIGIERPCLFDQHHITYRLSLLNQCVNIWCPVHMSLSCHGVRRINVHNIFAVYWANVSMRSLQNKNGNDISGCLGVRRILFTQLVG